MHYEDVTIPSSNEIQTISLTGFVTVDTGNMAVQVNSSHIAECYIDSVVLTKN